MIAALVQVGKDVWVDPREVVALVAGSNGVTAHLRSGAWVVATDMDDPADVADLMAAAVPNPEGTS